jgi:hypothetical protein
MYLCYQLICGIIHNPIDLDQDDLLQPFERLWPDLLKAVEVVLFWLITGLVKNSFISLAEADWAGSCVKIIRCLISPSGGRVRVIRPARFREI